MNNLRIVILSFVLTFSQSLFGQNRQEINLSGQGWRVWLDSAATWQNDTLFLPRTLDLSKIKENSPSCSWDELLTAKGIQAKVPATFEELIGSGDPL